MKKILIIIFIFVQVNLVGQTNDFVFEKMNKKTLCNCNDKILTYLNKKKSYKIYYTISKETYNVNNKNYFKFKFTDLKNEDFNGYIRKENNRIYYLHKHYDSIPDNLIETKELLLFDFNCKIDSSYNTSIGKYGCYKINLRKILYDYLKADTIFIYDLKKIEPIFSDVITLKQIYVSKQYGIIKVVIIPPFSKEIECNFN